MGWASILLFRLKLIRTVCIGQFAEDGLIAQGFFQACMRPRMQLTDLTE